MSFPVPTRTAVWALPYALGMATVLVGCSKQERPEVALRQASLAAQTPAAPADTADSQVVSFDAASNTVTFKLVAGPFNWNGLGNGEGTLTVPPKSSIVVNFVQDDGTPHSAEVASGEGPVPNSGGNPAIPRAYTNKVVEGLPQGATDVMKFSVPDSGKFRIICGVPGHATGGMWIWMVIDPSAKTPSFGPTPKS